MAHTRPALSGGFNGGADGGGGGDYFDQLASSWTAMANSAGQHPIIFLERNSESFTTMKREQVCIRMLNRVAKGSLQPQDQAALRAMVAENSKCTLATVLVKRDTDFSSWITDMTKPATLIIPDAFKRGPKG